METADPTHLHARFGLIALRADAGLASIARRRRIARRLRHASRD